MSNDQIRKGIRQAMRSYALQWRAWIAQNNASNAGFALRRAIHWREESKKARRATVVVRSGSIRDEKTRLQFQGK